MHPALAPVPLKVVRVRARIAADGVIDSALGVAALGVLVLHGNAYSAILAFGLGAAIFCVLKAVVGPLALRRVRRGRGWLEPLPPDAVVRPAQREPIWGPMRLFMGAVLVGSIAGDLPVLLGYGPAPASAGSPPSSPTGKSSAPPARSTWSRTTRSSNDRSTTDPPDPTAPRPPALASANRAKRKRRRPHPLCRAAAGTLTLRGGREPPDNPSHEEVP
jgi:hypothetical protein